MESRQLLTYPDAMQVAGIRRRTFFKRIKERGIAVYIDPTDRRLRWLDRRDIEKLTEPVVRRREESRA